MWWRDTMGFLPLENATGSLNAACISIAYPIPERIPQGFNVRVIRFLFFDLVAMGCARLTSIRDDASLVLLATLYYSTEEPCTLLHARTLFSFHQYNTVHFPVKRLKLILITVSMPQVSRLLFRTCINTSTYMIYMLMILSLSLIHI